MLAQIGPATQQQIQTAAALDAGWELTPEELQAMQLTPVREDFYAYSGFGAVQFNALDPRTWTEEQKKNFILNYEALRQNLIKQQAKSTVKGFAGYGDIYSSISSGISYLNDIITPGVSMYNSINNLLHPPDKAIPPPVKPDAQPPPSMSAEALKYAKGWSQYLPWIAGIAILGGVAYMIFKPKLKAA